MFSQSNLEKIKKIIEEFFSKTTFSVEVILLPQGDKTLLVNLRTESPQVLIGDGGQVLNEIQHLLKLILRRKIKEFFYIDIDINNYKKKKDEYLKEKTSSSADEVALFKKEKVLPPMSARERRIIHLALADRQDVITESIGQDRERGVVIKPVSE